MQTNTKTSKSIILSLLVFVLFIFSFNSADAVSLSPVRFELRGNPGENIDGEILVTNEDKFDATLYSSFANFEAQGESGNPAFTEPKNGLGTWMSVPESVFVPAHTSKKVPFSVHVPTDADPGGHFAVIFFGDTPRDTKDSVSVGSKIGALVLLSVNGDVSQAGGITQFNLKNNKHFYTTLPVGFEYKFKNDGGDRIKPEGYITVRNFLFYPKAKVNANPTEGNILPGSTRRFDASWVNYERGGDYVASKNPAKRFADAVVYEWRNFAVGPFFARLNTTYGDLKFSGNKTLFFFVFPWQLLIVIILAGLIVFYGGRKAIHKYNSHIIEQARKKMKI